MGSIIVLTAGEVIALIPTGGGLASGHYTLGPRPYEILDGHSEAIADPFHDVEGWGDLTVFDLREIGYRNPGRLANLGERLIERAPYLLETCSDLIRFH